MPKQRFSNLWNSSANCFSKYVRCFKKKKLTLQNNMKTDYSEQLSLPKLQQLYYETHHVPCAVHECFSNFTCRSLWSSVAVNWFKRLLTLATNPSDY